MARRVNSLSSTPTAISREINSEYDSVKIVADNIEDIKAVAAKSDSYIGLVDSINAASSILITSVDYLEAVELEVAEIRDTVVTARDQAVISAANASTSEINTAASEANAALSEASAANSADSALASANTAITNASISTTQASVASLSANNALTSENNAAISAQEAAVSEANAATSETNAGISESNALTYATNADTSAVNASTSETNALASAVSATNSEANASVSEANAATSESNAEAHAIASAVSETNASTSEINAASSEAAAALSESNAASSASSASASETSAATSATSAEASKDAALVAQLAAESSLDEFTDIYLGALATDPTTDNDGDPLTAGIFYYNTGDNTGLRVYSGTSWDPAVFRADGTVLSFNDRSGAVTLTNSDVTSATGQALDETGTPKFASIQITGGVNPNDGLMSWNSVDETIDLVTGLNTTYQLGQELGAVVRNLSGATIDNGTVVRVLGASGDKITVGIADNSTAITSDTSFAIVTETINNNSTGKVTTEGLVRGLDTSGFTEGDSLWLGTSGNYTNVHPISPVTTVHIGWVVRSHASDGSIYVKIDKVGNLNDSNDVLINSLQHGDFLGWDNASSLWKNITIDKSYIDSLGVDATTLDGFDSTFFEPADPDIVKDVNYVHTDNNFDDVYKSSVDRNTAVTGTSVLTRYDKLLNNLDVIDMIYDTGDLVTVRYQGDNNIDTFYRDVLNYTSGNLTSVYHFYNTSDLITTSATTVLGYTGNDLTSTTYTE